MEEENNFDTSLFGQLPQKPKKSTPKSAGKLLLRRLNTASQLDTMSENIESSSVEKRDETTSSLPEYKVVLEYLRKHEISFNDLCELRQKVLSLNH